MQSTFKPFEKVSVNGEILSVNEPVLLVSDQGFMYGYGVFDTLRLHKNMPFMVERHIERLLSSASSIDINVKGYGSKIDEWLKKFILEADIKDDIVRITVTKGTKELPCVIITSRPLGYTEKHYKTGFSVSVSSIRRNAHSPLSRIKSLNFLDNILARRFASETGFDEALMLNGDSYLCECSMSNLFFVKDEKILTPSLECGALNGITRSVVLETIAPTLQLNTTEGEYRLESLTCADEAFLTNSAMGIMPLISVDGHSLGEGKPGKITGDVIKRYENLLDAII